MLARAILIAPLAACFAASLFAASSSPAFPNESLDYTIQWPSGISLGEAHWKATNNGTGASPQWEFSADIDAQIPVFALGDSYRSETSGKFCTSRLSRNVQRGAKHNTETTEINSETKTATRKTGDGGGESTFDVSDCVHDALAFLFLMRHELVEGHVPAPQTVLLGSAYQVKATDLGMQKITQAGKSIEVRRVGLDITGPASHSAADVYFANDPVRTPIKITIPLSLGTFSLELAH